MVHSLRTDLEGQTILHDIGALERYLHATSAHLAEEQVRILFLNARNILIRDEVMLKGTVSGARLYPREILKRALELGATAIILVHNHPSGDPEPSRADIEETARLCAAACTLDVIVHDHLIIGRSGLVSLRARNLMPDLSAKQGDLKESGEFDLSQFAEALLAARAAIGRYFDPTLFADPAFDMLLALFSATDGSRPTSMKSCAAAARLPATTTLRWLTVLGEQGLVVREENPLDRRCVDLGLSPHAYGEMRAYLKAAARLLSHQTT